MNHVVLIGNLTADPHWLNAPPAPFVCGLRVACRSRRRDPETGEWVDKPNYFNVTAWGAQAENAVRYLSKGRSVAIAGRLEWSEWEDAEGESHQSVEVIASSIQFLGSGGPRATDNTSGGVVSMTAYKSSKRSRRVAPEDARQMVIATPTDPDRYVTAA